YSWNTDLGAAGWQGDSDGYGLDFVTQDYSCAAPPPTYPWAYIKTKAGFMVRDGHGSVVKFPNRISRVYSQTGNPDTFCQEFNGVKTDNLLVAESTEHDMKLDISQDTVDLGPTNYTVTFANGNTLHNGTYQDT